MTRTRAGCRRTLGKESRRTGSPRAQESRARRDLGGSTDRRDPAAGIPSMALGSQVPAKPESSRTQCSSDTQEPSLRWTLCVKYSSPNYAGPAPSGHLGPVSHLTQRTPLNPKHEQGSFPTFLPWPLRLSCSQPGLPGWKVRATKSRS